MVANKAHRGAPPSGGGRSVSARLGTCHPSSVHSTPPCQGTTKWATNLTFVDDMLSNTRRRPADFTATCLTAAIGGGAHFATMEEVLGRFSLCRRHGGDTIGQRALSGVHVEW